MKTSTNHYQVFYTNLETRHNAVYATYQEFCRHRDGIICCGHMQHTCSLSHLGQIMEYWLTMMANVLAGRVTYFWRYLCTCTLTMASVTYCIRLLTSSLAPYTRDVQGNSTHCTKQRTTPPPPPQGYASTTSTR